MSASAIAAIQTMRQNRAVRAVQSANALSPQTARTLAELRVPDGSAVQRLVTNGVLVPTTHDPTRFYFDEQALRRLNRRRLLACAIVIILAVVAVWLVRGR